MKKLTPFQKKLARWYLAHPKIHEAASEYGVELSILVDLIVPAAIILWFKMSWGVINSTIIALAMAGAATSTFVISIALTGYVYRKYVRMVNLGVLPECAIEDARKISEKYPEFTYQLEKRIRSSINQDDGTELREYLSRVIEREDLRSKLAETLQVKKNINDQITALEKELGL